MKRLVLSLCLGSILLSGCTSFQDVKTPSWLSPGSAESNYGDPVRLAVVWSYDIIALKGQPATPGFGGRIYFYDKENKAIAVDGDLLVYAFDDSKGIESGRAPDARYAFTSEQIRQHFSETDLGASYNVWVPIPWHSPKDPSRTISLVPVFNSAKGTKLVGNQSSNQLQGRGFAERPKKPTGIPVNGTIGNVIGGVKRVGHEEVVERTERTPEETSAFLREKARKVRNKIRTTTIPMSHNLTRQSQQSPSQLSLNSTDRLQAANLHLNRANASAAPIAQQQQGVAPVGFRTAQQPAASLPRSARGSTFPSREERLDPKSHRPKARRSVNGRSTKKLEIGAQGQLTRAAVPPYQVAPSQTAQPAGQPAGQAATLGIPLQ